MKITRDKNGNYTVHRLMSGAEFLALAISGFLFFLLFYAGVYPEYEKLSNWIPTQGTTYKTFEDSYQNSQPTRYAFFEYDYNKKHYKEKTVVKLELYLCAKNQMAESKCKDNYNCTYNQINANLFSNIESKCTDTILINPEEPRDIVQASYLKDELHKAYMGLILPFIVMAVVLLLFLYRLLIPVFYYLSFASIFKKLFRKRWM